METFKIYTSYYAGKKIGLPVSISRGIPRYFQGKSYQELAPYSYMLKIPLNEYKVKFQEILSKLDPHEVVQHLKGLAEQEGQNAVSLLCYEKPSDYCHRQDVAAWLRKAGYEVEEVADVIGPTPTEKKKEAKKSQGSLFD